MTHALHSRADVLTDAPARYAKQLVGHLGHKVDVTTDGATSTLTIGEATGQVEVRGDAIVLRAAAADTEALARVEDVLGRHLERFGTRAELVVTWTRSTSSSPW